MSRLSIARCVIVALTVVLSAAPVARAGSHPPDRNGFMIGFGLGGASLGLEGAEEREGSVTANFRIGYAVRPDLVIHYEGSAWAKMFETPVGDATWSFSTNTVALTWFPSNMGLFLRGGAGLASARLDVETGGVTISDDEGGFGMLLAGGYEFRLTKKFGLALQAEYTYQSLDTLESANMFGGGLGFNWYW
jgi:hypothetical protein